MIKKRYVLHMRHRGEMENHVKRNEPNRWVVERERVLAQEVQKAPHQVGEEDGELPRGRPASLLHHGLQENNIGIGSNVQRLSQSHLSIPNSTSSHKI